mgnify:CR=1 FL=1
MSYESWHDSFAYICIRCEFLASLEMQTMLFKVTAKNTMTGKTICMLVSAINRDFAIFDFKFISGGNSEFWTNFTVVEI